MERRIGCFKKQEDRLGGQNHPKRPFEIVFESLGFKDGGAGLAKNNIQNTIPTL